MIMAKSSQNGQKTPWEKENLLVTSNFSFSHSVFKRLVVQTCKNQGLFGNMAIIMTLSIGNGAVLKISSQWQF